MSDSDEAPGWDAIAAAVAPYVDDRKELHWGSTDVALPDQDGIWGISAYAFSSYWFFVTYGLTELFVKVSDDPQRSGWGHELTMRHHRRSDEASPPVWILDLLGQLGKVTYQRGFAFQAGDRMDIPERPTPSYPPGLVWADDPVLPDVDGPFGQFQFLTVVGATEAMLVDARATTTAEMLAPIRQLNPEFVNQAPGLTWD